MRLELGGGALLLREVHHLKTMCVIVGSGLASRSGASPEAAHGNWGRFWLPPMKQHLLIFLFSGLSKYAWLVVHTVSIRCCSYFTLFILFSGF